MFLEYDFTIVFKPGIIHVVTDTLSRLLDIIGPTCVLDQTTNASLFYIERGWLNDVKYFLRTGQIEGTIFVQQKQRLVRKTEPFTLKNDELYKMGQDNRMRRCLTTTKG